MSDWTFFAGTRRLPKPRDMHEIEQRVAEADPAYWNGSTGMSCFSRQFGDAAVHLYVSLASDGHWHLRYQFADSSFVIAHDAKRLDQPPVSLWMGGNKSIIPAEQCVDSAAALAIMRQFIADGTPYEMADWRVPKSQD